MKTFEPEVTTTDNKPDTPGQPDPKSARPKKTGFG